MRPIATGRRNWTFAGSDEGGRRAAAIYTLIETARLNDVDPLAWLADMLARLQDHPANRLDDRTTGSSVQQPRTSCFPGTGVDSRFTAPLPDQRFAESTPQAAAFILRFAQDDMT